MQLSLYKNTITNYLKMFITFLNGVLVTRWLINGLGEEDYGLWVLLWSFFSYSLLLDFGFGVTAQKYTAQEGWRHDIATYNKTISTFFSFHGLMGLVILVGTVIASFFTMTLFHLPADAPEKIAFCRDCLLIFGIGTALIFPTGMFAEILIGLQKIYLRNYIAIGSKVIELGCVLMIFWLGGSIKSMICFNLGFSAFTNLCMYFIVKKNIPGIRIRFGIDKQVFMEVFHFSCFVYLCGIAKMLWARGSSILIGISCGLSDVGYFQVGSRLPGLMTDIAAPYQENISPMVAALYAKGRHLLLGRYIVNTLRWNSILVTIMTVGLYLYTPEVLLFLFGVETPAVIEVCRVSAVALYFSLVFRTIPERFLLMAEKHEILSWTSLCESFIYIILCGIMLNFYSILCVVWISFFIQMVSVICVFGPVIWRYIHIGPLKIVWKVCIQPFIATIPLIVIGMLQKRFFPGLHPLAAILAGGVSGGIFFLIITYLFIMDKSERYFMKRRLIKSLKYRAK